MPLGELAAYLGMAALFAQAARSEGAARSRLLGLGAVGVIGSLVFSGYMGVISIFRLETLCLLCIGLYAVSIRDLDGELRPSETITVVGRHGRCHVVLQPLDIALRHDMPLLQFIGKNRELW